MFQDLSTSEKISLIVNVAKLTEDEINLLAKNVILASNMNEEELIYVMAIGELKNEGNFKNLINLKNSPFMEKLTSIQHVEGENMTEGLNKGMKSAISIVTATESMRIEYGKRGMFYTDCRKNNGCNLHACKDCDCFIDNDTKNEVIICKFGTPIEKIEL